MPALKKQVLRPLVRILKGQLLGPLFLVFFGGIVFERWVVLPLLRLLGKRPEADPDRMQKAHRVLFGFWLKLLSLSCLLRRAPAKGRPMEGPCVVVANHPGLFDVLFLIKWIPRMSVLVKRDLAENLPLGPIFKASGYVLSPDLGDGSPVEALQEAIDHLRAGYKFLLFPEGTRSPKDGLRKFKAGAFKIARMAGVPVQPVLIKNRPPFLPKEDKWYYPPWEVSRLELEFWEPIDPAPAGREREEARELESRYRRALGLE